MGKVGSGKENLERENEISLSDTMELPNIRKLQLGTKSTPSIDISGYLDSKHHAMNANANDKAKELFGHDPGTVIQPTTIANRYHEKSTKRRGSSAGSPFVDSEITLESTKSETNLGRYLLPLFVHEEHV
jgi:hypothetical protein